MTALLAELSEPSINAQGIFAQYVTDAIVNDASGIYDGERCVGEPPSARYFIGTLAPANLDLSAGQHRRGRETPNAAGFDFEVSAGDVSVDIEAHVSVYYRVFPTWREQIDFLGVDPLTAEGDFQLRSVFRRQDVEPIITTLRIQPQGTVEAAEAEFAAAFEIALSTIRMDPMLYRRTDDGRGRGARVPAAALADEVLFDTWCTNASGSPVEPSWSARLSARSRVTSDGATRVHLRFVNTSSDPTMTVLRNRVAVTRHDDDRDHFLFRTQLDVRPRHGRIEPLRMNLGPDAYRYDDTLGAYAWNCGVEWEQGADGTVMAIRSTFAPTHQTFQVISNEHPATAFDLLERDPLPALDALSRDMETYIESHVWSGDGLSVAHAAAKARDRDACRGEVARFRDGIAWLRRDPRILAAFRLTNATMLRVGQMSRKDYRRWRLFQLVFIVSQLAALAWREHPPESFQPITVGEDRDPTSAASVLWFPTGGGKTEAYLGLAACAMFYDRLRGKTKGVTAWCRLPLRLLTLQATQRQVTFFAAADEVRREAARTIRAEGGDPGDPFRVGVFMGESSTPNTLSRDANAVRALRADAALRARYRVVDECPYCLARTVEIDPPDEAELRLVHRCATCHREIQILVTDAEVYRFLPSFVVGTVDKLAMIGLTDKFGALLGDVDGECTIHGFGRGGKCFERRVEGHPRNAWRPLQAPLYDASPTLEIVDELHMLREELGVFDGHYETAMATIQRELSSRARSDGRGVRMKVVATTATIKGEDRQCEHLFGLRSVAFPLLGPRRSESFYWRLIAERPQRCFVGILPQRTTAEQALVRLLIAFHRAVRRVDELGRNADPRFADIPPGEFEVLRDLYRVSLTYVTSLLDFGKIGRSMGTQVNEHFRTRGVREVRVERMSADSSSREGGIATIRAIVDDLGRSGGNIEAILATSMVAHGVDIERLNVMFFHGMPKSMAEYIQASSRIGRRYIGVVFMLYNPIRERDRSHHRYHGKFHDYLDRMVEPVAINRWSRYAARKTLAGVLMAEILQTVNREWWDAGHAPRHLHELGQMQSAIRSTGGIPGAQRPALEASLRAAFLSDRAEAAELNTELEDALTRVAATIRAAGAGGTVRGGGRMQYRATGDHLGLPYPPMLSLRDVEEDIPIFVLDRRAR